MWLAPARPYPSGVTDLSQIVLRLAYAPGLPLNPERHFADVGRLGTKADLDALDYGAPAQCDVEGLRMVMLDLLARSSR